MRNYLFLKIFFVILGIFLIIFLLNFFSVINLPLLPHLKNSQQPVAQVTNNSLIPFSYDSGKAKTTLSVMAFSYIQKPYQPSDANVKNVTQTNNTFSINWLLPGDTGPFSLRVIFLNGTNTLSRIIFRKQVNDKTTLTKPLDNTLGKKLITTYFTNTDNDISLSCKKDNDSGLTFCSQQTGGSEMKRGYLVYTNALRDKIFVSYCLVPKESPLFPTSDPCGYNQ